MTIQTVVKEDSHSYLSCTIKNQAGTPVTPTQLFYTVHDVQSGSVVRAETEVTTPVETNVITLTDADNAILNDENEMEERIVTIRAILPGAVKHNDDFRYTVRNLRFLP